MFARGRHGLFRLAISKLRRGFNLAEVMVAMVFLTIAAFAILAVNIYTTHAAQMNRNREIANRLATTELSLAESILRINFHLPASSINTVRLTSSQYPGFDFVVEDLGFEDPEQNLRAIRCRVFWNEAGIDRTYELATTLYDY